MAKTDILGTIERGFGIGSNVRSELKSRQQQELLGGLRRSSLGLGGETELEQQQAGLGLLAASPAESKAFTAQQRFMSDDNLRSVGMGAIEALNITDELQQDAFLQNRIEQIEARGGDASDSIEALELPFAQRQQALQSTIEIAERAGALGRSSGSNQADFSKGKEFLTKDNDGNLILNTSVFDKRLGKNVINRTPVTEQLVDNLGDSADEGSLRLISDAGGKTAASAKAALSVKAAQDAFKQVVTIDAGVKLLDEGIAELEAGADVGILDKFLPSIKEASSRFDNVADRMGLQVVQSVTFGALSAGELKVAMATAVPPNLDNKQLIKWFKDRKAAQLKLRSFYVDIARKASQENKTPAEIMIEIEDKKAGKKKAKEETGSLSDEDLFK